MSNQNNKMATYVQAFAELLITLRTELGKQAASDPEKGTAATLKYLSVIS